MSRTFGIYQALCSVCLVHLGRVVSPVYEVLGNCGRSSRWAFNQREHTNTKSMERVHSYDHE